MKKGVYPKKVYELAHKHFDLAQQHSCFAEDGSWECPCFMGDYCSGGEGGPDDCKTTILNCMKYLWNRQQAYKRSLANQ